MNTIVESVIVARAREIVQAYLEWCEADESFDAGEFSRGVERTVPEEVMAAANFLEAIDHPEDQDDC